MPTQHRGRQRLSLAIMTRNSETRLPQRIAEAAAFADEIVVGVDASSTDRTLEVACEFADVVYQFRHLGQTSPARLLPFEYATGDWILSLDEDECIETAFDVIVQDLLREPQITHYYFPRKCVVNASPGEYLHASPWFPDWQLRLFRNDPAIVWKPPRAHSGYFVEGLGAFESRASILHFEPLLITSEQRRAKFATYVRAGSTRGDEERFAPNFAATRRPVTFRETSAPRPRRAAARIDREVRELVVSTLPPWKSIIESVATLDTAAPGSRVIAEVTVRNVGKLAWCPPMGKWPELNLAARLADSSGNVVEENFQRSAVPRHVRPGEQVTFLASFQAPSESGEWILEWDMVSEGECWFAACGSKTSRSLIRVG